MSVLYAYPRLRSRRQVTSADPRVLVKAVIKSSQLDPESNLLRAFSIDNLRCSLPFADKSFGTKNNASNMPSAPNFEQTDTNDIFLTPEKISATHGW